MSKEGVLSHDGSKRFLSGGMYEVNIKSAEQDELLIRRKDFGGYHQELGFSLDDQKVIYYTQCKHCYVNPCVTVWDFVSGKAWSLRSEHHRASQIIVAAHNDDLSQVVLACNYGEVSLIHPYENKRVWHRRPVIPINLKIHNVRMDEERELVWVSHERGIDILSLVDGSTRTQELLSWKKLLI